MECMDRESMRKLQSERLVKTVKTCYEKVPFYKKKMDRMGVKPEEVVNTVSFFPFFPPFRPRAGAHSSCPSRHRQVSPLSAPTQRTT